MLGGLGSTGTMLCTMDGEANWLTGLLQEQNAALELDFAYERWAKLEDGRVAVRFVTSWATEAADCEKLASALEALA